MSLRNQPYLPLYVKDFRSDDKLARCSASSHGVYILLLCILHCEQEYGKIMLRQKERQNVSTIKNFADVFVRMMPFGADEIEIALTELVDFDVIQIDGDTLYQKRMVKDGNISELRALAGKKGSIITNSKHDFADAKRSAKPSAKIQQNTASEIEYANEDETVNKDSSFDVFWKAYPRKTAKEDARKAYAVLMKKKDAPTIDRLIESIEAHKRSEAWKKDDGQFIPHPATYIRQGRYDDEIKMQGGVRKCKLDENGEIVYES